MGPNQDSIASRALLSELRPLIKSKWGPFGDRGAPEAAERRGSLACCTRLEKKSSYVYVRRIPKFINRLIQATGWGSSTYGKLSHTYEGH